MTVTGEGEKNIDGRAQTVASDNTPACHSQAENLDGHVVESVTISTPTVPQKRTFISVNSNKCQRLCLESESKACLEFRVCKAKQLENTTDESRKEWTQH